MSGWHELADDGGLTVELRGVGGEAAAFSLIGELDISTGPRLEAALEALEPDVRLVCLDATSLSFLDAGGVRSLLRAEARAGGPQHLVIKHATPIVQRVLHLCKLDHLLAFPHGDGGMHAAQAMSTSA